MEFTPPEVSVYYACRVPKLAQSSQAEWRGPCPIHRGKNLNFAVDSQTGLAKCWSKCGRGWDMIALEMELTGVDFAKAKDAVFRLVGRPADKWIEINTEATYDYLDKDGAFSYQVVRKKVNKKGIITKEFRQRTLSQSGSWVASLKGVVPLPYRLPELLKSPKDVLIGIAEGERCVEKMRSVGWIATTNSGGAGNFKEDLVPYFTGRNVAIFPDNDAPGRSHAEKVAKLLFNVAASVRIVEIPGLAIKGDVYDYLESGKTADDLYDLYAATKDWAPDWEFKTDLPSEEDQYFKTMPSYVGEIGGLEPMWKSLEIEGIRTPFNILTEYLGGLRKQEVYVLAANTGQGKTSLALQFAIAALEQQKGVLMFSMEMGHRQIFQRIIAIDERVDLKEYRRLLKYPDPETELRRTELLSRLKTATEKFMGYPLWVSTKGAITMDFLVQQATRLKKRNNIDLVIVDHMQLMGSTGKPRSDYEKFTAISRSMKGIASDLDVPILLVSQTSRQNAYDKRLELEISDLRGAGSIEEDTAAVMLIYYDTKDFNECKLKGNEERLRRGPIKAWLKLGKNRYGEQGVYIPLEHYKALTRFDLQ